MHHSSRDPNQRKRKKKYEDPVEKRKINNILDDEQKKAYGVIDASALTLLLGPPGTGKTLLAVYYAIDKLIQGLIEKVVITRPTYSEHTIGFLPGSSEEKMMLYVMPMISNMYKIASRSEIDYFLRTKIIEILPQEFIRGVTINNGVMIVDEVQNTVDKELKTIVTRIGKGGKIILSGDKRQIDLKDSKYSGLERLCKFEDKDFGIVELKNNHRHPIVQRLVEFYEKT